MKVFISWSGNRSEYVAKHLCDWLKNVIQTVDPWISKHIESGATWARELADELEKSDFGVACVTPENQFAPWLLFEAGAISKKTSKAFFCPYLLDMKETDLKLPLSSFQGKIANREGTFDLVQSINKAQPDNALNDKRLEETFNVWWPGLEKMLREVPRPETSIPKARDQQSMIEEILETVRNLDRMFPKSFRDIDPALWSLLVPGVPEGAGLRSLLGKSARAESPPIDRLANRYQGEPPPPIIPRTKAVEPDAKKKESPDKEETAANDKKKK